MIYRYLQRRLSSLIVATLSTIALGIVSAVTFALVGPAWQILSQGRLDRDVTLVELFGERLGKFVSWLVHRDSFPSADLWAHLPLLIVITAALRASLSLLQWFLWERSSELVARDMRQDLIDAFLSIHPEARREIASGIDAELAANIGTDIRMVREYLVHFLGGFPRELVQVVFYLITLFMLEPRLASFFILGLGPAGLILTRLGRKLRLRSQKVLNNVSQLSEWLQQRLSGIETIKQFRTEATEVIEMEKLSGSLFRNFEKAARLKARTSPLLEIVAVAAMLVVMSYGITEIDKGQLNSSILLSFFSILAILSQSAAKLGRYVNSNKEGEAALHRLADSMLNLTSASSPTWAVEFNNDQKEILVIRNLTYRYPRASTAALNNLNLVFDRGRIYAVAGPSGSGKSTLLKIVLGLWRVKNGELVCGVKGPEDIGYLPQSIQIMPGSIAANIAYPEPDWDVARLWKALESVQLRSFVENLPKSFLTEIGEGALSLSGGQAQRVQLARLFYHRFPLIIIDEGTSALDPETESLIFEVLRALVGRGSTILMVAHRLSALKVADELIVLRRGAVYFQGAPERVLRGNDWRELFEGE